MGVKNIIISFGVLILLIAIIMNLAVFTTGMNIRNAIRDTTYTYIDAARQDGYFSSALINNMLTDISSIAHCNIGDIIYTVTTIPKYRTNVYDERELIEYDISVPYQLFIGHTVYVRIVGKVPSERL